MSTSRVIIWSLQSRIKTLPRRLSGDVWRNVKEIGWILSKCENCQFTITELLQIHCNVRKTESAKSVYGCSGEKRNVLKRPSLSRPTKGQVCVCNREIPSHGHGIITSPRAMISSLNLFYLFAHNFPRSHFYRRLDKNQRHVICTRRELINFTTLISMPIKISIFISAVPLSLFFGSLRKCERVTHNDNVSEYEKLTFH